MYKFQKYFVAVQEQHWNFDHNKNNSIQGKFKQKDEHDGPFRNIPIDTDNGVDASLTMREFKNRSISLKKSQRLASD
ncbi:hypothetical protein DERF_002653 [Dermatophagoides farinae]|uniref:Uncharacterized protein n=1 Tax=Dermatophagoides farinae TaxID=6954 RepID=A0A922IC06_DERFA|nr:hypothetical protein DERF_002653 [Dermatophagoides farinae]